MMMKQSKKEAMMKLSTWSLWRDDFFGLDFDESVNDEDGTISVDEDKKTLKVPVGQEAE